MSRYDSMGIARDLINFEKNSSGKVNGVPENLEPCVATAYRKFKNNPSQLDEFEKLETHGSVDSPLCTFNVFRSLSAAYAAKVEPSKLWKLKIHSETMCLHFRDPRPKVT